jgi:hypothetical protein
MAPRTHRRPQPPPRTPARPWWQAWWALASAAGVIAVVIVVIVVATHGGGGSAAGSTTSSSSSSSGSSSAQPPLLASADSAGTGQTIDGIQCQSNEQVVYHIHAHLAVFVNGAARTIPEGIGIPPPRQVEQSSEGPFVVGGKCYYWLHSHTGDGIIHIESPSQQIYTLGNWFDIWQQPLSNSQVGPATGTVIAYVNGERFTGDVRSIPLNVHALIQLDVGTDVAPKPFTFPAGL